MKLPKTRKRWPAFSARPRRLRVEPSQYLHHLQIDEHEGHAFIAMEFLDGLTLKHAIGARPMDNDTLCEPGD